MMEAEEIKSFKDRFAAARRAVEAACAANDAERIRSSAEGLMSVAEDETQYDYPGRFDEDFEAFDRTILTVPRALRSAGWSAADVIVWAYKIGRPSECLYSGSSFERVTKTPCDEYADRDVWMEVAERLQVELKSFSEGELESEDGNADEAYQLMAIHVALSRAGCESKGLDLLIKYVPKIKNWKEVADRLNKFGRYGDAIRVAREGIRIGSFGGDYQNDSTVELMSSLADAFSGKGDHQQAAAILAEQFLGWCGVYGKYHSVEFFNRILKEAEMAGVRNETRTAIIHALKTGVNPSPLVDWKVEPPIQEFPWRPVPKQMAYRAPDAQNVTPRWPLPRSKEGLKFFDLRWDTTKWLCQHDQEFLLKLAVADGDKQEIIRRFDALPEFPNNNGFPVSDDKLAMLDAVAAAVGDVRPDIAEMIKVRPNRFRKNPVVIA